jgi:MFS family permease
MAMREDGGHGRRVTLLTPLRQRDFALLWSGMTVSLLGDGIYFVAIAWQVYALSNAPTALSVVGVAWTLPTVIFLLVGGAISDRRERRRLLLAANLAEAVAIGLIGVLSVTGALELWMLFVLVAIYGAAEAFFIPAFDAIVPTLVGSEQFTAASALDQFVRPLTAQLLGPALGGVLLAVTRPGVAFLVDAGTFLVSIALILSMRRTPATTTSLAGKSLRATMSEIADGFRFVRANPWLWGTLLGASLSLLAFFGPSQVLLPYLVKNRLHSSGGLFGVIRAGGGVGAIAGALAIARSGLPRRRVTLMFVAWSAQSVLLVAYAVATGAWTFVLISLLSGACGASANVVWGSLMMTLVPDGLRGRVSSLDWMVSIGLIPLSFAITGPIAQAVGATTTLLAAGCLGGAAMIAFLAVPGVRDPERSGSSVPPDSLGG